jgi:predicted nucleotidyltransferase
MNDDAIIEQAVERLRSEFGSDLLGVLVGGSRVRSEGDAHSDIDVVVVVGPVAGLVGIEGGVVSGVINLESPGV